MTFPPASLPACAAERAAKCPYSILLQHHCPLPLQLRQEQQRRRREQQQAAAGVAAAAGPAPPPVAGGGAAGAAAAAAAAACMPGAAAVPDRVTLAPLPSQGTLLQQVRRGQQQWQETPVAPASADLLMDELFAVENGQQQQQPAQQEPGGAAAAAAQRMPVAAAVPAALALDAMMDELATLEAQQAQQHPPPSKRQQCDAAGAAAPAAAGNMSHGSLPPTQAAATVGAAPGAEAAVAAAAALPPLDPASLASCFVPHKRVVAFVWATLRSIVPAALLGGAHNRRVLLGAIRQAPVPPLAVALPGCAAAAATCCNAQPLL